MQIPSFKSLFYDGCISELILDCFPYKYNLGIN